MYGGIISGNAAKGKGGAVHIGADSIFNMAGGTITGNTAGTGAVYVIGTLKLSGNARIEGNTGGDIYLDTGSMICDALNYDYVGKEPEDVLYEKFKEGEGNKIRLKIKGMIQVFGNKQQ
jgi:hypothetical protein